VRALACSLQRPELLKLIDPTITLEMIQLQCEQGDPPTPLEGRVDAPACHESGTGIGVDNFDIATWTTFAGNRGAKIIFTDNQRVPSSTGDFFSRRVTTEAMVDTVDQAKDLVLQDGKLMDEIAHGITLDMIALKCDG
jgi:hypothetical protein